MNVKASNIAMLRLQGASASRRSGLLIVPILVVCLALGFRIFNFFPGFSNIQETAFVLGGVASLGLWILMLGGARHRLRSFEGYAALFVLVVPFYSAVVSHLGFGQPLTYGLLAQRNLGMATAVPLGLLLALRRGWIGFHHLEKALLTLAWGTLVLFFLMSHTMDASKFWDSSQGFVNVDYTRMIYKFKLDEIFIVFGFYYYMFLAIFHRRSRGFLLGLLFLAYLVLEGGGRSGLLALLISFVALCLSWTQKGARGAFLLKFALVGLGLSVLLAVVKPEYFNHMVEKFGAISDALFESGTSSDTSANARYTQFELILPYIADKITFGTGIISNRWEDGIQAAIGGGYFHPSDLGLIGIVFLYGIIGLLFFLAQYLWAFRFSKRLEQKGCGRVPILDATQGVLFFYLVSSVTTGRLAFYPEVSLFFIALLLAASQRGSPFVRGPAGPQSSGSVFSCSGLES